MKAKDLMTRRVVSVGPDATLLEAARLMQQHGISGLPVVDAKGALVGVVSEGDFLRRGEAGTERRRPGWLEFIIGPGKLAAEYAHAHGRHVSEVMSTKLHTIEEETPIEDIVQMMERFKIKRLPVLRDDRVVGIVTRANVMRAVVGIARYAPPPLASDTAIHDAVLAELDKCGWAPLSVGVDVHEGVVDLWGCILDERQREALKVLAENVPGVKGVKDHMAWVEPMSGFVLEPPGAPVAV